MFLKNQNIFSRIFIYKCKYCVVWNWFITKNYFNLTKIFVSRLFKMSANHTDLFSDFWWLRNVKFKEYVTWTEKHVSV